MSKKLEDFPTEINFRIYLLKLYAFNYATDNILYVRFSTLCSKNRPNLKTDYPIQIFPPASPLPIHINPIPPPFTSSKKWKMWEKTEYPIYTNMIE